MKGHEMKMKGNKKVKRNDMNMKGQLIDYKVRHIVEVFGGSKNFDKLAKGCKRAFFKIRSLDF